MELAADPGDVLPPHRRTETWYSWPGQAPTVHIGFEPFPEAIYAWAPLALDEEPLRFHLDVISPARAVEP